MAHTGKIEYKDELGFRDLGPIVKSGGASPIEITCGLRMMNKSEVADAVSTIRLANILGRTKEGENLLAGAYNRMGKSIASGKLDKSFYEAQGHVLGVFDAMLALTKAEKDDVPADPKKKRPAEAKTAEEQTKDRAKKKESDDSDEIPADPKEKRPYEAMTEAEKTKARAKADYGTMEKDEPVPDEPPVDEISIEEEGPSYEPPVEMVEDIRGRTAEDALSDMEKRRLLQMLRRQIVPSRAVAPANPVGVLTDEDLAELDDIDAYRSDAGLDPMFNNSDYGLDAASWRDDVVGPEDAAALARDLGNYSTQFPDKV